MEQAPRRYFLVNYQAITNEGHIYLGLLSIMMEDGRYINRKYTEKLIRDNTNDVDLSDAKVVIANITELDEEDYLDWYE